MQEKFKAGERVKHETKTEWGIGEVLSDESGGRIKVFFEDVGAKELDLRYAKFIRVFGEEAKSDYLTALVKNHLTILAKPTTSGNKRPAFMPFQTAIERFLSYFPAGFQDSEYRDGKNNERKYKEDANRIMLELLGKEAFANLLQQGNFKEIVDRATKVMNQTNLIHHIEMIWFTNGVKTESSQKKFAESLFGLLYGDSDIKIRFEQFSEMLSEIGAAKWPIATYFLFITFPDSHMFIKPMVTQNAANILGMEINYRPELNWLTYSRVQELAELIRNQLRKDGRGILAPENMIDIQSFVWVISPGYFK